MTLSSCAQVLEDDVVELDEDVLVDVELVLELDEVDVLELVEDVLEEELVVEVVPPPEPPDPPQLNSQRDSASLTQFESHKLSQQYESDEQTVATQLSQEALRASPVLHTLWEHASEELEVVVVDEVVSLEVVSLEVVSLEVVSLEVVSLEVVSLVDVISLDVAVVLKSVELDVSVVELVVSVESLLEVVDSPLLSSCCFVSGFGIEHETTNMGATNGRNVFMSNVNGLFFFMNFSP